MHLGPRLVVAGTHSGVGKTTVATGLLAALRARGVRAAGAKVGPDFIDPGYHALATGQVPRNLDPWLCGSGAIAPLAARASAGRDVLVVEGVMGLFDGATDGAVSSTADVAGLLNAPIVLVVDASALSDSVAALVYGYDRFLPHVRVAAVVLNRVGSPGHEILLREALAPSGIPVLGALPRDDAMTGRDRHLGLVPVVEREAEVNDALVRLAGAVAAHVDLDAVMALAGSAAMSATGEVSLPAPGPPFRVAVAGGPAFSFTYTDTIDALQAAGGEVVPFDPLVDRALPAGMDGLIVGGGFPEVFAAELSANQDLLADLRAQISAGLPTWAECGGLLLLARGLDGHRLAGVIDAEGTMTGQLTLGYRTVVAQQESPVGRAGIEWRGHEFHYSALEPAGDALRLTSRWGERAEGWATPSLLATYVHHHPGGDPSLVSAFAAACTLRHALRMA